MTPSRKPLTRILIVEDDEDDFLLMDTCIREIPDWEFIIDWSYKYGEALNHIAQESYDLYFVDFLLGERTGLELLKDAMSLNCEKPIILLTGVGRREVDIEAMTVGAVDYLVKSEINTEKLERSIRYALERSAYISALKVNERKFRSIFEQSKDAIFLADEGLFFRDVNNATCELFKFDKEALLRSSLYVFFAREETAALLKETLRMEGAVEDWEVELLTRKKEKRTCILSISRQAQSGGDAYLQAIIHDITNLKRIERATFQIEKLRSTAMLLRTLAHEVRNPLTNITLSLEQLKSEASGADIQEYLDIIARNCGRIDSLISELLDLSRPAAISLQKVSLQSVLDNALAVASDRIALKGIQVGQIYPKQQAYVMADAEKLKIAILNIIINAIEAVSEGTGKISIRIEEEAPYYRVFIDDNGYGIPDESIHRIFEPYFTSKTNGFGLGLAATWNILQSHHAMIDVNSQLGAGTSFILTFSKAEPPA